jgi:hypothetical protein
LTLRRTSEFAVEVIDVPFPDSTSVETKEQANAHALTPGNKKLIQISVEKISKGLEEIHCRVEGYYPAKMLRDKFGRIEHRCEKEEKVKDKTHDEVSVPEEDIHC